MKSSATKKQLLLLLMSGMLIVILGSALFITLEDKIPGRILLVSGVVLEVFTV